MRVGIVAPRRPACGVSDYTEWLASALGRLVDIAYIAQPEEFRASMNDVDIVHIQHEYFVFGGVAPWKNRFSKFISLVERPAVMTVHEIVPESGNPAFRAAVRLSNRLHFANPILGRHIVHTAADRHRLARITGGTRPIDVIRLAVPNPPDLPSAYESKRKLGLEGEFVATIYGFISRKKGHLLALDALKLLPEDVTLIIAGGQHPDDSTDYVASVRARARDLGERARITEYLSSQEVLTVMAATDLILAPFSESSGSASLAQAFACGLPILGTDIHPHREIIEDTPDSMTLTSQSPEQLARAVLAVRYDDSLLDSLRSGASRYAAAHSMARTAEQMIGSYEDLLKESAA